jgi:hypothetical protein
VKEEKEVKCCKLINKQLNYELTEIDEELFKYMREKIIGKLNGILLEWQIMGLLCEI